MEFMFSKQDNPNSVPFDKVLARKTKVVIPVLPTSPRRQLQPQPQHQHVWGNLVFREKETGTFRLYFIRAKDERVSTWESLDEKGTLLAACDSDRKILFIKFTDPAHQLACHLFDYSSKLDSLEPMALHCYYAPEEDIMTVYFVDEACFPLYAKETPIRTRCAKKPFNTSILFDVTPAGRILSIEIVSASKLLQK